MTHAVEVEDLVKTYGRTRALDGVTLQVPEGRVLGLLGPNGAGKTTTVRVLTTLLRPDSGRATVLGIDVLKQPDRLRQVIGVAGQYAAIDELLTGRENLALVGRLYHLPKAEVARRADELLERFELTDAAEPRRRRLLRRHAPPPGPRGVAGEPAAGAVPRRADHRPGPAQPAAAVGGHRGPRP